MEQRYVCSITPTEFEKYCMEILCGYAEKENLIDFTIDHNVKIPASDGTYQIDVYASFMAMGVRFKVLCECKQYSSSVSREKVAVLKDKLQSIGAQKGILLSTAGFQSGALEYAKAHGIALVQVYDRSCDFLCHSSGEAEFDENDPFLYGERKMPPYVGIDVTDTNDEGEVCRVYPTREIVGKILDEMERLIEKWHRSAMPDLQERDGK